jgi:hypothetical protein
MAKKDPAALVAERELLLHEFDAVVRLYLHGDPDAGDFKVVGATFDPSTGAMKPRWVGLNAGRRNFANGAWAPDRSVLVELLARTWELRSLRWSGTMKVVRPHDVDWDTRLSEIWPGAFDCELSVQQGWADLIATTTSMIAEAGETIVYGQIKQKFGSARLYFDQGGETAFELTTLAEHVSGHICEVCGGPGKTVDRKGWLTTLCTFHEAS